MTPVKENEYHICKKESEIARHDEQIKTLFNHYDSIGKTLFKIEDNQDRLIEDVSKISSIIDTSKWFIIAFSTIFGGILIFLVTELIKIVH